MPPVGLLVGLVPFGAVAEEGALASAGEFVSCFVGILILPLMRSTGDALTCFSCVLAVAEAIWACGAAESPAEQ